MWFCSLVQESCSGQAKRQSAACFNAFEYNVADYAHDIPDTYKIDITEDLNVLPRSLCPINEAAFERLRASVNFLSNSESNGMDIYVGVLEFIIEKINEGQRVNCETCLFVGLVKRQANSFNEFFPECTRSCFSQVVLRRRGGDRIYEMRSLFVAVEPNARFTVLPHWDNMS